MKSYPKDCRCSSQVYFPNFLIFFKVFELFKNLQYIKNSGFFKNIDFFKNLKSIFWRSISEKISIFYHFSPLQGRHVDISTLIISRKKFHFPPFFPSPEVTCGFFDIDYTRKKAVGRVETILETKMYFFTDFSEMGFKRP